MSITDSTVNYDEEYNELEKIKNQHTNFKFTKDVEIHEKYISAETYSNYLNDYDTICLQSNMNTGKLYLPTYFISMRKLSLSTQE